MFQTQRRLNVAADFALAKDVGNVIGAERLRGISLLDGGRDTLRSVVADQLKQFANLPRQAPVRLGKFAEVVFRGGPQQFDQALLRLRALGGGQLCE